MGKKRGRGGEMLIAEFGMARGWTLRELVYSPAHKVHYLVLSKLRALCAHGNRCSVIALQRGAEMG